MDNETITITVKEYNELKADAEKYRKIANANAENGKKSAARFTPEERRARALKASMAAKEARERRKREQAEMEAKIRELGEDIA